MRIKQTILRAWRPFAAIVGSMLVSYLVLLVTGYDGTAAIKALFSASFNFSSMTHFLRALTNMLNKTSPLLFTGLALAISFRCNVFNVGTEGQFLFGCIAAVYIGYYVPMLVPSIPGIVLRLLIFIGGAVAGAIWGLFPGYLKVKHGVSEIITTIMLNYVALHFIGYLVRGPIMDLNQAEAQSVVIAKQGYMPYIIGPEQVVGVRLHAGFFIGCVLAIILYVFLFKTFYGYEIRATGYNQLAAKCCGISVNRTMMGTMLLSGALAGLGGAVELAGNTHYLLENISPGYGFTAIAVSILASNNPAGIILSATLFGFLSNGAGAMQKAAGVTKSFVDLFQGIIIVVVGLVTMGKKIKSFRSLSLRKEGAKK